MNSKKFFAGLAIIMMASPFLIHAAEPERVVISRIRQKAFAFMHDGQRMTTDELSTRLYKSFVRPYYFAREAAAAGVALSHSDSAEGAALARWQAVRYYAAVYDSMIVHSADSVSPADQAAWYHAHLSDYRHYAVASYIQATLAAGHEADTTALLQELQRMAAGGIDAVTFQKGSTDRWSMNAERDVTILPGSTTYPYLATAQKGQIVRGSTGKGIVYFYLISHKAESSLPIDEVRADITRAIRTSRISQYNAQVAVAADSLTPIHLNADMMANPVKGANQIYGTIGRDTIDNAFIAHIQSIFPRFHFSERPEEFRILLQTYVAIPQAKCHLLVARRHGVTPTHEAQVEEQIRRDIYQMLLSEKYEKQHRAQATTVTDAEVQEYYRTHQSLFMRTGTCSYLKAELIDTTPATLADARRALQTADIKAPELKIRKDGKYVITREEQRQYGPGTDMYATISATALRTVTPPVRMASDGPLLLLLPYQRDEPKAKPVDEVRDLCRQNLVNEKQSVYSEKLKAEIFSRYVFVIE